jgi:predicted secreted hydrolase
MLKFFSILVLFALFAASAFFLAQSPSSPTNATLAVSDALSSTMIDTAFKRVFAPRTFIFPQDHAPHDDYKTEWWYFTGNLRDRTGRRFGYQLTFFRSALAPNTSADTNNSSDSVSKNAWKARQIFMAHFTVTDVQGNQFVSQERFSRVAQNLAGAVLSSTNTLRVWLDNWSAETSYNTNNDAASSVSVFPMRLQASSNGVSINLMLDSTRPVVLQGERGFSQKSEDAGNASYYYSLTRLPTHGTIRLASGEEFVVEGTSWFDREWSTSALSTNQIGWDWFALHFDDGRDFMFYQLRKRDGTIDAASKGVLVTADGAYRVLGKQEVECTPIGEWESPRGSTYPASWRVRIPSDGIEVVLTPLVKNQELDATLRYWEGAVGIAGTQAGKRLSGHGYVEMTGYADKARAYTSIGAARRAE